MPRILCEKCIHAILPKFAGTNYICQRKAPKPGELEAQKAYWKIIDIQVDGCGEGELKKEKK